MATTTMMDDLNDAVIEHEHASKEQDTTMVTEKTSTTQETLTTESMDVSVDDNENMEVSSLSTESTGSPKSVDDTSDVLDLDKLRSLLEQSKKAGNKIAGKDVLLFIGGTGAGKTTTTLYLAGAKFNEVEEGGEDHYEPYGLPDEILSEFLVSGSATSVTKTIHATTIRLPNGEDITICDTPGFGDTKGAEMEISNGLGVIHALKKARTVKPVLLFDQEGMSKDRFATLRKTLNIVISMMGGNRDFIAFEYVFSRCDQKKSKKVHKKLSHFHKSRNENPEDNTSEGELVLDALLLDMIEKTTLEAIYIEPDDEDAASDRLEQLLSSKHRLENPATAFVEFVSEESSNKLTVQVNRMLTRMDKALKMNNFATFQVSLQHLHSLMETLPLPEIERAVKDGQETGRVFVDQARSQVGALVDRMIVAQNDDGFKKLVPELQKSLREIVGLDSICKLCQVPVENSVGNVLKTTTEKLFGGFQNALARIKENAGLCGLHSELQTMLLRIEHTSGALDSIVESGMLSPLVAETVETVNNIIKSQLDSIEKNFENPTSQSLEDSKDVLLSLVETKDFLERFETSDSMASLNGTKLIWLKDRLGSILKFLGKVAKECIIKLSDHVHRIEEDPRDFNVALICHSLSTLSGDDEVVECRAFLSVLSSSCDLWKPILKESDSDVTKGCEEFDPAMLVAHFDDALSNTLTSFTDFSSGWAGEKHSHSDKKKAEKLLESVESAIKVCNDHKDSLEKQPLDGLNETKGMLKAFIKKCNSVPQRPDDLLYGPEELGKRFHARLLQLRAYKIEHGDCDVPKRYNNVQGLGKWVNHIRCDAKRIERGLKTERGLNDKKIEALSDLDFVWVSPRARRGGKK